DEAEEKEAVANLKAPVAANGQDNGPKTIGDLIKAQMGN
ncbi:MAG: RNA-binding protein, partial [Acinetobacter sp.]